MSDGSLMGDIVVNLTSRMALANAILTAASKHTVKAAKFHAAGKLCEDEVSREHHQRMADGHAGDAADLTEIAMMILGGATPDALIEVLTALLRSDLYEEALDSAPSEAWAGIGITC